jgi:hypothetical protein
MAGGLCCPRRSGTLRKWGGGEKRSQFDPDRGKRDRKREREKEATPGAHEHESEHERTPSSPLLHLFFFCSDESASALAAAQIDRK